MTHEPDLDLLARRYMDVCERQLGALLADPELIRAVAGFLAAAQRNARSDTED